MNIKEENKLPQPEHRSLLLWCNFLAGAHLPVLCYDAGGAARHEEMKESMEEAERKQRNVLHIDIFEQSAACCNKKKKKLDSSPNILYSMLGAHGLSSSCDQH